MAPRAGTSVVPAVFRVVLPRGVSRWQDDGEAEAGRVIYLDFIGGIARL